MPFWEDDLSVFYSSNTPGCIQVTFVFATGESEIWVQWFSEYEGALLFGGEIESRHPYLMAKDSDMAEITHASTFVKNGTIYNVIKVKAGDSGETVVELSQD